MSTCEVSILIVTWNRRTELARSIASAMAQTCPNKEIVLVENGCSDGTAEMVRGCYPSVQLVRSPRNLGCPSGRNLGFAHCRGEFIYMLDDDGWLKEDAVEISLRRAKGDQSIGVVMSRIHEMERGQLVRKLPPGPDEPQFRAAFSGGCSLIRRAALEKAGGFPEDFFRQGEESDLALRLLDAGYFCFLEPASIMYHAPSASGRNNKHSMFYTLRNANKTGLRLWPFPWCVFRLAMNMAHALRFMISMQYPALPLLVFNSLVADILRLPRHRSPVSSRTYGLFRSLQRRPSVVKPCAL